MATTPLLILGFNRPDHVERLIESLRPARPSHVILSVDGPRAGHPDDYPLVSRTQAAADKIDWNCRIETIFRSENLGLRTAVADAVTRAVGNHGRIIVVEDDVVVGPNFLSYMNHALDKYESYAEVAHINGYNVVPPDVLGERQGDRYTRYIESFAWATWDRAWNAYDPALEWALNVSLESLRAISGSRSAALRWRRTFKDASDELMNTWAYRWLATIWSRNWKIVSPSENLVRYAGWTEGTHTLRRPKWSEIPVSNTVMELNSREWSSPPVEHTAADRWLGSRVFGESYRGVAEGILVTWLLRARQAHRRRGN